MGHWADAVQFTLGVNAVAAVSKIAQVSQRLSGLLVDFALSHDKLPGPMRVREWVFFAQEYMTAASCLEEHLRDRWLAQLQVSGHSVECALKAFHLAAGVAPPTTHDLVALCESAETKGCHVTEMQAIAVFQLSLHFYRDLATGAKYKARYPTVKAESSRAPVPEQHTLQAFVGSVCQQALGRVERDA